jgi:hypothetical protein
MRREIIVDGGCQYCILVIFAAEYCVNVDKRSFAVYSVSLRLFAIHVFSDGIKHRKLL